MLVTGNCFRSTEPSRTYDKMVIEKTNETSARVFPVVLDVNNDKFWTRLERLVANNAALEKADASGAIAPVKLLRKLPKLPLPSRHLKTLPMLLVLCSTLSLIVQR